MYYWDGVRWTHGRDVAADGWQQYELEPSEATSPAAPPRRGRRRAGALLIGVCAAVAVAATVAALSGSTPRPERGLLKSSTAIAIYQGLMPRLQRDVRSAAATRDLVNFVDRGALRSIIAEASCGCLQTPTLPATFELVAPVETSYPLSFLTETDQVLTQLETGAQHPYVFLTIFTKPSPTTGWRISYYLQFGDPTPLLAPSGLVDTQGSQGNVFPTQYAFSSFASALTGARDAGRIPMTNYWGGAVHYPNSMLGQLLTQLLSAHHYDAAGGGRSIQHPYFVQDHSIPFAINDGDMECATITGWGRYVKDNQVQPSDRSAFGNLLAPGVYSSVSNVATRQICISYVSTALKFIGLNGGVWLYVGTPEATIG
jgi:hypothetical protein